MPDLLTIRTANWILSVWSRDISPAKKQWRHMLDDRGRHDVRMGGVSVVCNDTTPPVFEPALTVDGILPEPVFFENRAYEFEFFFSRDVLGEPCVTHRLTAVCDSFRFKGNALRGTLILGNDIGWFGNPPLFKGGQK